MKTNLLSLFVFVSTLGAARADTASGRGVFLLGGTCPGGSNRELVRWHQNPDGTNSVDSGEFVVPAGELLELTDIELQPSVSLLSRWQDSVVLIVQNKSSLHDYVAASFGWGPAYLGTVTATSSTVTISETAIVDFNSTRSFHFESGILVGPSARLCVSVPSYLGNLPSATPQIILRGKLISDGTVTVIQPPPPVSSAN